MHKPNTRAMMTNDAAHAAMRDYARAKARRPLRATVTFADGSTMVDDFPHAPTPCEYRTPDGEIYTQDIDGPLILNNFLPGDDMKPADFKRAYEAWLNVPGARIHWSRAPF